MVRLDINPMIWGRIPISSDLTIEDLHYIIPLVMGKARFHHLAQSLDVFKKN